VRLVRRKLGQRNRFYAQLVCRGTPYRKPFHQLGSGIVGPLRLCVDARVQMRPGWEDASALGQGGVMRKLCSRTHLGVAGPALGVPHLAVKQRNRVYAVPYKGCVPPHNRARTTLPPKRKQR
jgi:hypothetical protein